MRRLTRMAIPAVLLLAAGACAVMWPRRKAVTAPVAATRPATQAATAPVAPTLSVTIKDLRSRKGVLIFGVFSQPDGFPNVEKKSVYWEVRDASSDDLTFVAHLPPGKYAASVLHDENRSGDMDKGFGGLPLEGYGVTNNPKPKMRAATFNEAAFTLPPEGKELTISVQYQFL
jgi:uncharacterized protein (DUF2141 family)